MNPVGRVAIVGLGPIGLEVARAVDASSDLKIVAVVDPAPAFKGKTLGDVLPGARLPTLEIDATLAEGLQREASVMALCTRSKVADILADLDAAVARKVHVVTCCEELSAPPPTPELLALDGKAQLQGVSILATGVNPGFVMDRWPLQLAAMCVTVRGIKVERVVDAAQRREPLRRKVGHGLTLEQFERGVADGTLGHVGLPASAVLLARGLGSPLASLEEETNPIVDDDGKSVLGVRHQLKAALEDGRLLELVLEMYVGAADPHDRVILDADPPIDARIEGGLHGDRATVAAILDGLRRVRRPRQTRGVLNVADVY